MVVKKMWLANVLRFSANHWQQLSSSEKTCVAHAVVVLRWHFEVMTSKWFCFE